jgi:hypothetical protein
MVGLLVNLSDDMVWHYADAIDCRASYKYTTLDVEVRYYRS